VAFNGLVKGTGGVTPLALQFGFEFTVGGGDHQLTTITLTIGNHLGTQPLEVELYGSPSGPETATFLTSMVGPTQPANQDAVYTPALPVLLADGETYFVRLAVPGNASNYSIPKTSSAATGVFTLGTSYQRNPGNLWGPSSGANPIFEISANAVPEPAAICLSGLALVLTLSRRRS
jgi:hypothetical protein